MKFNVQRTSTNEYRHIITRIMGIDIFIFYQNIQSQLTFVLNYANACSKVKLNNKINY